MTYALDFFAVQKKRGGVLGLEVIKFRIFITAKDAVL